MCWGLQETATLPYLTKQHLRFFHNAIRVLIEFQRMGMTNTNDLASELTQFVRNPQYYIDNLCWIGGDWWIEGPNSPTDTDTMYW